MSTSPANLIPEPLARWSSRLSLFAGAVLLCALALHRSLLLSTPVAMNVSLIAYAIAALGFLAGLAAFVSIWIKGRAGATSAILGILIALAMATWPAAFAGTYLTLPAINDITTDVTVPPPFTMLSRVRGEGANSARYPGQAVAAQQSRAYPDLRTLVVERSVDEVFDLAVLLVRGRRGLGWRVLVEEPPTARPLKPGIIEATERTLVLGFIDDISIRISGNERLARVDIRSASRFGRHDFGTNATRIRRFIRELQSRLDSTVPAAIASAGGARGRIDDKSAKRPKERSQSKGGAQSARDPARPDAQRAPGSKAQPRG